MLAAILKKCFNLYCKVNTISQYFQIYFPQNFKARKFYPRLLLNYLTFKGDKNSLKPQIYSSIKMRI